MLIKNFSNLNLDYNNRDLPKSIYGLRILDLDSNPKYNITIAHDGYCPPICSEREESRYNVYLSNLEDLLLSESKKTQKIENYCRVLEYMTNKNGEFYQFSKAVV